LGKHQGSVREEIERVRAALEPPMLSVTGDGLVRRLLPLGNCCYNCAALNALTRQIARPMTRGALLFV
jgi:hypothetical protein